jgi:DNA-binding NtrC family response regulator
MEKKNIKVLYLEDDAGDARLIQMMLDQAAPGEFTLSIVPRLGDALKLLGKGSFDLVLSDLDVPDSRGLETFLQIHAQSPGIPIIVLSGLADYSVALQAVQQGAQDYLLKGQVTGVLLARSLRYANERKRAELERDRLILELGEALAKVKVLSGLLPMCSSCNKFREDNGYRARVENFLLKNPETVLTHGLCPDCLVHDLAKPKSPALAPG